MSRHIAILIALMTAILLPVPALAAGDEPAAQEPRVHDELARAPSGVVIAFTWELNSEAVRMYVLDSKGTNITSAAPDVSGTNMTVDLDFELKPGTYSVYYRANDREGGLIGGAYQFAIGKGKWTKLDTPDSWSGSAEQPAMFKGPDPNQPASEDDPTPEPTQSPGLEIVKEDGTVERPADIIKARDDSSNGSPLPWIIGGSVALAAAAIAAIRLLGRRNATPGDSGKHAKDSSSDT